MTFFDNRDNGKGARTFFETLRNTGMTDALLTAYDPGTYIEGLPLALSHKVGRGNKKKRYDFVYLDCSISPIEVRYTYEDAVNAGSDHAAVIVDADVC